MGLFDAIAKQAFGGSPSGLLDSLLREAGGLTGMRDRFTSAGLGEVFSSWVAKGENLPINTADLQKVLGSEAIQSLAARVGFSPDMILPMMSQFLPQVIDRLTPQGTVEGVQPTADQLQGLLGEVMKSGLSSLFGRKT